MKECILNRFSLAIERLGLLRYFGTCCLKLTPQSKVPHLAVFICCQKKKKKKSEEKWKIHSFIWKFPNIQMFGIMHAVRWLIGWAAHIPHVWHCVCRFRFHFQIGKYNVFYVLTWDPKANGVKWIFFHLTPMNTVVLLMLFSPTKMQVQIFYCS